MMKHIQRPISLALLTIALASSENYAVCQKPHVPLPNYVLHCHGVTNASTSLKQDGPRATVEKSSDELLIARFGQTLEVQVNAPMYQSMDRKAREILQKPDPYKITGETGEGFVAVFVNGTTTLHTLTVDRSLTHGIWVESGFSFLELQSEPISNTVFFTCKQEKQ